MKHNTEILQLLRGLADGSESLEVTQGVSQNFDKYDASIITEYPKNPMDIYEHAYEHGFKDGARRLSRMILSLLNQQTL